MYTRKKNIICYSLFILIIVFHFVNNYLWLKGNNIICGIDVVNHLFFQLKFHHLFSAIISIPDTAIFLKIRQITQLINTPMASPDCIYWPNFVFLSSTFFSLFFGNSLFVVRLTQLIYFFILLFSTYAIAKEIADRKAGLLAMFLVSMYSLVFESSRQYSLDFPLTALTALSVFLLLKTNYFTNFFYSVLLGVFFGVAMLVKGQFLLFFIFPLIIVLNRYVFGKNKYEFSTSVLSNFFVFSIIATTVSFLWWGNKIASMVHELGQHLSYNKFFEIKGQVKMYNLDFYLAHLKALMFDSLGIIFSSVFLFSFAGFVKSKVKYKVLLISWILTPLILFSVFFVVKHSRFLMPILPAIAIVSAWGITRINNRKLRNGAALAIILLGLIQYYALTYFLKQDRFSPRNKWPFFGYSCYETARRYDFEKMEITRKAAQAIRQDCVNIDNCRVGIVDIVGGSIAGLEIHYWLYFWNPNLEIFNWLEQYREFFYNGDLNFNYLIFITNKNDKFSWPNGKVVEETVEKNSLKNMEFFKLHAANWDNNLAKLSAGESEFKLIKTLEFSNGCRWYIYKRKVVN